MGSFIDGHHDIVECEKVHVSCPFLYTFIIKSLATLMGVHQGCKKERVKKVNPFRKIGSLLLKRMFEKAQVET